MFQPLHLFIYFTLFIFLFAKQSVEHDRWNELPLIFNTALRVQHLSHGAPLYLCLPLTQSGLGICHLPPCIVHRNDRILAGTCRSHPACFSWIAAPQSKWKHVAPTLVPPLSQLMHLTSMRKKPHRPEFVRQQMTGGDNCRIRPRW